jgi:hypothetical protein
VVKQEYSGREQQGLDEIVTAFVTVHELKVQPACFGIAGPQHGRVQAPNLARAVDSHRRRLNGARHFPVCERAFCSLANGSAEVEFESEPVVGAATGRQ